MDNKQLENKIKNATNPYIKEMYERALLMRKWGKSKQEFDTYFLMTGWFHDDRKETQTLLSGKNRG